jgi:hypothetical protein
MQRLLQFTPNPVSMQAQLADLIKLLRPIYHHLALEIRHRRNVDQLKADDCLIIACMLYRIETRDVSERHLYHCLIMAGLQLPERSRFNRRCRAMANPLKTIRLILLHQWVHSPLYCVIDSAPILLTAPVRNFRAKVLKGVANIGFNATKQLYFYGLKWHCLMTAEGYIYTDKVTPAATHDMKVAQSLIETTPCPQVLGDVGYLSQPLKQRLAQENIHFWTPVRKNMKQPTNVDTTLLKKQRRTIETVIGNLNTVGHFEHLGIRTKSGLSSRLAALLTWHTITVHKQLLAGRSGLKIIDY